MCFIISAKRTASWNLVDNSWRPTISSIITPKREVSAGRAPWPVTHHLPDQGCWTINPNIPEDLIRLEEDWLCSACKEAGLAIDEPIRLGG